MELIRKMSETKQVLVGGSREADRKSRRKKGKEVVSPEYDHRGKNAKNNLYIKK